MNMVARVAARHMSASHLEAPPAMVKAILALMTDLYVNRALAFILNPGKPPEMPARLVAFRDDPNLETLSALKAFFTMGMRDKWSRITDPKSAQAKKLLKTTWDEYEQTLARSRERFEQQSRVYREAVSLLSSPPSPERPEDVEQDFMFRVPLDLTGWRYKGKVPSSYPLHPITVQSHGLPDDAGGSWDDKNRVLRLPLFTRQFLRDWDKVKDWLTDTLPNHVYHECQHMAQSILNEVVRSKTPGLPGRKLQTPQWDQQGVQNSNFDPDLSYFLDDSEFHTLLTSAIHLTRVVLHQNPKTNVSKMLTDLTKGREVPIGIGKLNPVSQFFRALRLHAPAKYRKAVGEFVKAIL
jgi:hypothetical protein